MIHLHKILILVAVCLLSACATTPKDPNVTTDHRWIGGAISLEARKLDEMTYLVTARGAGACKEEQVMKAWVYMAEKMATGRLFEKTTKTESYNYSAPTPYGGATHHTGLLITGQISIK